VAINRRRDAEIRIYQRRHPLRASMVAFVLVIGSLLPAAAQITANTNRLPPINGNIRAAAAIARSLIS
jgi:hypothetical protein